MAWIWGDFRSPSAMRPGKMLKSAWAVFLVCFALFSWMRRLIKDVLDG